MRQDEALKAAADLFTLALAPNRLPAPLRELYGVHCAGRFYELAVNCKDIPVAYWLEMQRTLLGRIKRQESD